MKETEEPLREIPSKDNSELIEYTRSFFGVEIQNLSQEEVTSRTGYILQEFSKHDLVDSGVFSFILPDKVTSEEIEGGNSSWAKVYRALFTIASTEKYKSEPKLQIIVRELQSSIDQNPQMVGPVAMWDIAKDIMWRKDISSHIKQSLMGSMTYVLAFFDTETYENELLKNLDLKEPKNYAETAHMLEAIKQFWTAGHESYAEDRGVPDFFVRTLRKIVETPNSNYLLSLRVREILTLLEQSEDFPAEARDIKPFELSKGIFVSKQNNRDLTLVPKEDIERLSVSIANFDANESMLQAPQWMVDEAISTGESYVSRQPDQSLIRQRRKLFAQMHDLATIPLSDVLSEAQGQESLNEKSLQFDYEYLVSRPVRELMQREFSFELNDLTIQEQFYFLNYLKNTTVATVETMKLFIANFGIDAMRAFLVNQHDESASENIMITGIMFEEGANPLFHSYANTLDAGEKFAKNLKANTRSLEVCSLMGEFQDGLLKREGHLFFASKQMGLYEYAEDHSYDDLVQAFSGVAKMQDTLSRVGHDETLVVNRNHAREGSKNPLHDAGSETFYFDLEDRAGQEKLSLKVFVRPTANSEGEARINFELLAYPLDTTNSG